MRSIKKILSVILLVSAVVLLGVVFVRGAKRKIADETIITSNFISYDFARAVIGEDEEIGLLLKPGTEMHDFEPTPEDIIKIKNAELFIYVGGESEEWVEKILRDNEIPQEKTLKLMDLVELKEEELTEGMESEEEEENEDDKKEYDEHIWTSPKNAIQLVSEIKNKLVSIYPERQDELTANWKKYVGELEKIDEEIRGIVEAADKDELVFADRFPFRYFVDEYGLKYYAAFPGCSDQTEASSKTIAFLINRIKDDEIKVVLKIELTSDKLAKTIAEETGVEILEFNAAHNISQEDFERGVTYVEILKKNLEVLEKALR